MAIKGMAQVRANLRKQLTLAIPSGAEKAMHVATSIIGGYATLMTPVDTSNLINSQYRIVKNTGTKVIAAIGYTAKYAAAVHEMSGKLMGQPRADFGVTRDGVTFGGGTGRGNYWDPDAEPKFLSKAGNDNLAEIDQAVERAMKL